MGLAAIVIEKIEPYIEKFINTLPEKDELKQPKFEVRDYVQYNDDPNIWGFISKPANIEADWNYIYMPQHEEEGAYGTDLLKKLTTSQYLEKMDAVAKDKGLVAGVKVRSALNGYEYSLESVDSSISNTDGSYGTNITLFNAKTRKWAEIVEEVILVTEDGVSVTDPEQVVYALGKSLNKRTVGVINAVKWDSWWLWFSTPEARDEYIKWNVKEYSLNDILSFYLDVDDGFESDFIDEDGTLDCTGVIEQWEKSRNK